MTLQMELHVSISDLALIVHKFRRGPVPSPADETFQPGGSLTFRESE